VPELQWLQGQPVLVLDEGSSKVKLEGLAAGAGPGLVRDAEADSTRLRRALSLLPVRSWPAEVDDALAGVIQRGAAPSSALRELAEQRRLPWLLVRSESGLRLETTRSAEILWQLKLEGKAALKRVVGRLMRAIEGTAPSREAGPVRVSQTRLAPPEVLASLRLEAVEGSGPDHLKQAQSAVQRWPADPAVRVHEVLASSPGSPELAALKLAHALNPLGESELLALALLAEQRARDSRALRWRGLLSALYPKRIDYLPALADQLAAHGDRDAAVALLRSGGALVDSGLRKLPSGTAPHQRPEALPAADLRFYLAWFLAAGGGWELAAHNYLEAEQLYERLGRPVERGDALNNAGVAMVEVGRPLAAMSSLRRAVALREAHRGPERVATSRYNLARAAADAGRHAQALEAYAEAASDYDRAGRLEEGSETLIERLELLARQGKIGPLERAAEGLFQRLGSEPSELLANLWTELGRGRHLLGAHEAALIAHQRALALWKGLGSRLEEGQSLYLAALPQVALMRLDEAHHSLIAALRIAVELGDSSSMVAIRDQLGLLGQLIKVQGGEVPAVEPELRIWLEPPAP
tara:strand:+ start:751 stop:2496 length:1746 start_codon:yes stop_codon:yes gene_type:complete